ncbi:hypothetical protein VC159_08020 [Polynucleobacter sp. JS-JIR-II-c23]|jgi:hypothetical protein|uniref:hypothetical protein n=1 Tax=Polynucleobacter sp. JS-JIR-II-c23 TaxID=1758393 RepID=UPI002B22E3C0|nr:hypothetical protein [Polynucleobacter sp. JS-JIR-II-c23]MEA9604394.1 hypothetical protein [Polynucleobacter sp. JS-JIR-II-c23]
MATRAPRKSLSTDDYKAKLAKAKEALKALEEKAYASELEELIKKQNIVSSFKVIQANTKGVSDLQILSAIGKAVGIKRLSVTQTEPKLRAKKSK